MKLIKKFILKFYKIAEFAYLNLKINSLFIINISKHLIRK